jgi:peptide/nickel transport system permease protein
MAEALAMHEQAVSSATTSQIAVVWHRFRKHTSGVIGLATLVLLALSVVILPIFIPFDLYTPNPFQPYAPMGTVDQVTGDIHWLGTDWLGRDVAIRLFIGGRVSLGVALLATALVVLIGSLLGGVSGYYGGVVDNGLMRFTDFLLAMPLLPLFLFAIRLLRQAPALVPLWRTQETNTAMTVATITAVFAFFGWMGLARLVRGTVLSLREQNFVEAARALGVGNRRIIFKHLLPNSIAPILVAATFAVGDFVILEAILSYFNQGINDPPLPSWGNMLTATQSLALGITNLNPFQNIRGYLFLLPAVMVLITVLSINFIGDAIRSALDPHESRGA